MIQRTGSDSKEGRRKRPATPVLDARAVLNGHEGGVTVRHSSLAVVPRAAVPGRLRFRWNRMEVFPGVRVSRPNCPRLGRSIGDFRLFMAHGSSMWKANQLTMMSSLTRALRLRSLCQWPLLTLSSPLLMRTGELVGYRTVASLGVSGGSVFGI